MALIKDKFDILDLLGPEVYARLMNDECLRQVPFMVYEKGMTASEILKSQGPFLDRDDSKRCGIFGIVMPATAEGFDPATCLVDVQLTISFLEYPQGNNDPDKGIGISGAQAALRALCLLEGWESTGFAAPFTRLDGSSIAPVNIEDDETGEVICCSTDLNLGTCILPDKIPRCPRAGNPSCEVVGSATADPLKVKLTWEFPPGAESMVGIDGEPYDITKKKIWFSLDGNHPIKGAATTEVVEHGGQLGWQETINLPNPSPASNEPILLRWFAGGECLEDSDTGLKLLKVDEITA